MTNDTRTQLHDLVKQINDIVETLSTEEIASLSHFFEDLEGFAYSNMEGNQ